MGACFSSRFALLSLARRLDSPFGRPRRHLPCADGHAVRCAAFPCRPQPVQNRQAALPGIGSSARPAFPRGAWKRQGYLGEPRLRERCRKTAAYPFRASPGRRSSANRSRWRHGKCLAPRFRDPSSRIDSSRDGSGSPLVLWSGRVQSLQRPFHGDVESVRFESAPCIP